MYTDYLLHFVGRDCNDPEKILKEILECGYLKPGKWKVIWEHTAQSIIAPESDSQITDKMRSRAAEREQLLLSLNLGDLTGEEPDSTREDLEWINQLRYKMVCFTDLSLSLLAEHRKKFGEFALALRKDSQCGKKCEPVHYVTNTASSIKLALISHKLSGIVKELLQGTESSSQASACVELVGVIESIEKHRLGLVEDADHLAQHEWRFLATEGYPRLNFSPQDVEFVIVDNSKVDTWNKMLSAELARYADAGVTVKSAETLQGG